jgi:negative elongation factor A
LSDFVMKLNEVENEIVQMSRRVRKCSIIFLMTFQSVLSTLTPQPRAPVPLQAQPAASPAAAPPPAPTASSQPVQAVAPPAAARRSLTLTKEQMMEAQEMFRTANRVTRPEKALILGFMAGSRDNPCPHLGQLHLNMSPFNRS